mmetsp:Transcript_10906/g.33435  ORF Transcript_10906/g.33435 Transcript_10906/m.33435 type:complete len:353 (+) Transcript_10906:73-1131(+)|eukprot:CAMPEP_0198732756 /NCGR_PEP_ID=MMETSP1475-20131203/39069_1 /TAXON_ID= ORGANISM="Unidentified sp., Strain CCMP1999" /NCGR_SAMPLE_ID=MMETSP1475 /ASSEMBLY_ACC=CAM_ASM_001111 /LENGTH=352 /DNA_ID=CAMNT_0044495921 /DNA_START=71 /DNA_END=1129 /DNA_ORIENTATION=+
MSAARAKLNVVVIMGAWFLSNGSTILLNKYIMAKDGRVGFNFPLSLTMLHMFAQAVLAFLTIGAFNIIDKVVIPKDVYFKKIIPISVFFCANIMLGNISLKLVPVSFMQTLKSLTPVFTACLQYVFFSSRLTRNAILALIPATFGVALSAMTELSFDMGGFVAAMLSCLFTGLKFVLSFALLGGKYKLDAVNLLFYMAPPSVAMLLPLALWKESADVWAWTWSEERTHSDYTILIISAFLSFALNCTLFMVLKATSSVTVTIAGNLKTLLVIMISIYLFKNPVQAWNYVGMLMALVGITWYGLLPNKWKTTGTVEISEGKETKEDIDSRAPASPVQTKPEATTEDGQGDKLV